MSLEITTIAIALGGLIASYVSKYLAEKSREKAEEEHQKYIDTYKKSYLIYFNKLKETRSDIEAGDNWSKLIEDYISSSVPSPNQKEHLSEGDIQNIVEEQVNHLNDRIHEIEERFPSQDTVDKISSVNDAILATQIEHLTEKINTLENNAISKWDVAIVVFQIIAAMGVISGIIFGLASYFSKSVGG